VPARFKYNSSKQRARTCRAFALPLRGFGWRIKRVNRPCLDLVDKRWADAWPRATAAPVHNLYEGGNTTTRPGFTASPLLEFT